MARRNVNVPATIYKDPAIIIFTNRMNKARKLAKLLIRFRVGYYAALRMGDEEWIRVAQLINPKWDEVSGFTRRITLGMLAVRHKVKPEGLWV